MIIVPPCNLIWLTKATPPDTPEPIRNNNKPNSRRTLATFSSTVTEILPIFLKWPSNTATSNVPPVIPKLKQGPSYPLKDSGILIEPIKIPSTTARPKGARPNGSTLITLELSTSWA